jgi:hypothetical protein
MDNDNNAPFSELKSDFTKLFLDHNLDFFAKRTFNSFLEIRIKIIIFSCGLGLVGNTKN